MNEPFDITPIHWIVPFFIAALLFGLDSVMFIKYISVKAANNEIKRRYGRAMLLLFIFTVMVHIYFFISGLMFLNYFLLIFIVVAVYKKLGSGF